MALGSEIRAGAAFVELRSKDNGFSRGLKQAERQLEAFGAAVRKIGAGILIAGGAATTLALLTAKAASDAEESMNRFNQVFQNQTAAAAEFVEELAKRVGRSSTEIMDSMASLQSMFVGLGFDRTKAREMSEQLSELAIDFASFNNMSDDEAVGRFISALSGSSEVLDRFGINIKQAALEQELFRMGITKSWSAVTEQEKALARYSIIARTLGEQGAVGDATRTAASFANQMKRLQAGVLDAKIALGNALLPSLAKFLGILNPIVKAAGEWIDRNRAITALVVKVAGGATLAGAAIFGIGIAAAIASVAMGGLASIMAAAGTVIGVAGTAIAALLSPIGLVITGVVGLGAMILSQATNIGGVVDTLVSVFKGMAADIFGVLGSITDAIIAGDLELAVKIAGKGMQLAWKSALQGMRRNVVDLRGEVAKAFVDFGIVGRGLDADAIKASIDSETKSNNEELTREIRDLIEELNQLRKQKPDSPLGSSFKSFFDTFQGFDPSNSGVSRSVRGTFEGSALRTLASPTESSIESNTKKTAKATQAMQRYLERGGGGMRFA